jgi:hypothetical protein
MRRLAALLLAGFAVPVAYAQAPDEQATGLQEQTRAHASGSHHAKHHIGVDREAAVGHALGMAIEGSTLWHFAQKAESAEANTKRTSANARPMRAPGEALEKHARDAFQASDRLFQAVMQDERATRDNSRKGNGASARRNGQEREESDSARYDACEAFFRAARDYSRALETSCSKTRQAGAQSSSSIASDECAENSAKVALINHAVKEAVQGVALQQMLRHHGERDRTTQALESHAQQMLASSRHAIDSVDAESANLGQARNQGQAKQPGESQTPNQNEQGVVNRVRRGLDQVQAPGALNRAREQAGIDQETNPQQANPSQPQGQETIRRQAARPIYNDERAHSNLKPGEAITVQRLARLGREVIRSVERLNQSMESSKR